MEKLQIEEFPDIDPNVVRATVILLARSCHAYACRGVQVQGVTLRVEGDRLNGFAEILDSDIEALKKRGTEVPLSLL